MIDNREKIIVGRNGNLAKKLKDRYPNARVIPSKEYLTWEKVLDVRKIIDSETTDIFVAIGIVSRRASAQDLELINYKIPALIASAVSSTDSRIITFGTIMEKKLQLSAKNPYVASKNRLSLYLQNNLEPRSYLHLLINTLYGGYRMNPEMFLGQLFASIKTNSRFNMSDGSQIREYHHIEDDLRALELFLEKRVGGVQEISHGESFHLEEIARQVLIHFNMEERLIRGALNSPTEEIYEPIGVKNLLLKEISFRPTIDGIISYINQQLDIND